MSEKAGIYAMMIAGSTVVQNVACAVPGTVIPGFKLVAIENGICCNPGSYYNEADGKFYQDSAFKILTGIGSDMSKITLDTTETTYTGVNDLAAVMQDDSESVSSDVDNPSGS
ncbi:hypothetical protein [Erwinia tasmaniensis]|uniref:hypothetical protein n=1 Tax=Erwinia tasmaniensis TaxID=338565 RepID=UPI003A4D88FC